ncbi:M23 family metallopeptidase [Candidatus Puniceispirillum sp.]|nr:M23 family metallopeptidase [Candidatus Puniceispirillum sp.]
MGLFLASSSHSYEVHIKGAEILSGQVIEGGLIIARTDPSNQVTLADDAVRVAKNGVFVIGFHRDSDTPETLAITTPEGNTIKTTLSPEQRDYKIQRIDGLKSAMVTPPAAVLARIKADGEAVRAARKINTPLGDFWHGFDWPVHGRISGVYGSQRILNGQPRQPHYGIDIASPLGTPVYAPANGRITLVKELYFSGWTIVMAHGLGVNSSFLHLDKTMVKPGAFVKRGAVIGTIGATGRATGPHLDWRIDWQGRRIDPGLLVGPMPPK